jgi:hypothetical protein
LCHRRPRVLRLDVLDRWTDRLRRPVRQTQLTDRTIGLAFRSIHLVQADFAGHVLRPRLLGKHSPLCGATNENNPMRCQLAAESFRKPALQLSDTSNQARAAIEVANAKHHRLTRREPRWYRC